MSRPRKNGEGSPEEMLARYARIVEAFEFAGLPTTQKAIGAALSPPVTQGAVSHWKYSNPSVGYLCQIVEKTGVNGHWLLLGEGSRANADAVIQSLIDRLAPDDQAALLDRAHARRHGSEKD
jgi:hypothetical protein